MRAVEPLDTARKGVGTNQPLEHVQNDRGLVVDQSSEDPAVALHVAQPVSQMNRAMAGQVQRRLAHLLKEPTFGFRAAVVAGIERGEVLREALTEPLFVIVLPADRLAPPLMGRLMRQKKERMTGQRYRIAAPGKTRRQRWLIPDGEVCRAVAAWELGVERGE